MMLSPAMKFFLQQGHGMMDLNKYLVGSHRDTGVILSPRSLKKQQLERHAREIKAIGGTVLFDPQFYEPRTNHPNILSYEYWGDGQFSTHDFDVNAFCTRVVSYQVDILKVDAVIIPGRFTNNADESW